MKILVAGSSGLIGRAVTAALRSDGHEVTCLVRRPASGPGEVLWNPGFGQLPLEMCATADAIVNLCGSPIDGGRWTERRKGDLRSSRIDPTQTLARVFTGADSGLRPGLFINASAIGIYGDRGNLELNESSEPGRGFLADLCRDWESAALVSAGSGARVVCLRLGVVLSQEGGALQRMSTFYRAGLGGVLGTGRQWMSWIALEDVVGAVRFILQNQEVRGPVNLVAPDAVINSSFDRAMSRIFGRQLSMPVPRFALRLAYGSMAEGAILASAHVVPSKLEAAGYPFRYPKLEDALYQALAREKTDS